MRPYPRRSFITAAGSLPAAPSGAPVRLPGSAESIPSLGSVPHLSSRTREHQIAFPYNVDQLGRTGQAGHSAHIQQLMYQLLFTTPGERVNRPSFGCDLKRLVFSSQRNELGIATETLVQSALTLWMPGLVKIQSVTIQYEGLSILVDVFYTEVDSGQSLSVRFAG